MSGFVLPTFGMPCCGHRVDEHTTEAMYGYTSRCRCCSESNSLADALVLMADEPPVTGGSGTESDSGPTGNAPSLEVASCPGSFAAYDGQGSARGLCNLCEQDADTHDFDLP